MTRSRKTEQYSRYTELDNATCLLSFIVNRLPEDAIEGPEAVDQDMEPGVDTHDVDGYDEERDDLEDECFLEIERDKQHVVSELQNKLLDRLAETLARYKSKPGQGAKDAKHVAATMMIPFEEEERVEMVCAKNEGLDREDEIFLQKWKTCMESMAIDGIPSEDDQSAMFDLVFKHQKPRINTYISWLKHAFERTASSTAQSSHLMKPDLKTITEAFPLVGTRSWIDAYGLVYDIPINTSGEDQQPEARSIETARTNIDAPLSRIMHSIDTLCGADTLGGTWDNTVKRLMEDVFEQWQGIRTQAAIRAYFQRQLSDDKNAQKDAQNALTRLARVYKCVRTFIHAAERVPTLKSITITPVRYKPGKNKPSQPGEPPSPIEVVHNMGLRVKGAGWVKHVNGALDRWRTITKEKHGKCHFHAELQALYYHDEQLPTHKQQRTHPYIGCSRRNCGLCYLFIRAHGKFAVRGTHQAVLHRWDVPRCASVEPVVDILLVTLKVVIQYLLEQTYPIRGRELLAQSSKALSSAQSTLEKESTSMERSPRDIQQLLMGNIVVGDRPIVLKPPSTPGYAHVFDDVQTTRKGRVRTMTLEDAELLEANYLRRTAGLEPRGEDIRPIYTQQPAKCRQCGKPADNRCSACRVRYCSRSCQRKHWSIHVFTCCVRNRPNDADRLRILVRQWVHTDTQNDEGASARMLRTLFADDDICRAFGFTQCSTRSEVSNLICIYSTLVKEHQPKFIQDLINEMRLGQYLAVWVACYESHERACGRACRCLSWYMERYGAEFMVPDWESHYLYKIIAVHIASSMFQIEDFDSLSWTENCVARLYTILFRSFNNIPTETSAEWINFGFCYCTDRAQTAALADAYISLAESGATLAEIANAWKEKILLDLMENKGMNVSFLQNNQIALHKPPPAEFGAYRLVSEVNHALCGTHCTICTKPSHFHSVHEPILSMESEGDYGFTATNSWERWQLLRFYHGVFSLPRFSARQMQMARHDPDPEALENYLDSLVQGFRLGISNIHLAGGMFPTLGTRVRFPNGAPSCYCIVHSVRTPDGL